MTATPEHRTRSPRARSVGRQRRVRPPGPRWRRRRPPRRRSRSGAHTGTDRGAGFVHPACSPRAPGESGPAPAPLTRHEGPRPPPDRADRRAVRRLRPAGRTTRAGVRPSHGGRPALQDAITAGDIEMAGAAGRHVGGRLDTRGSAPPSVTPSSRVWRPQPTGRSSSTTSPERLLAHHSPPGCSEPWPERSLGIPTGRCGGTKTTSAARATWPERCRRRRCSAHPARRSSCR